MDKETFKQKLDECYTDRDVIKLLIEEIQDLRDMVLDLQDETTSMKEDITVERDIYYMIKDEIDEAIAEHVFVSHETPGEVDE
jgi:hypothetical protein